MSVCLSRLHTDARKIAVLHKGISELKHFEHLARGGRCRQLLPVVIHLRQVTVALVDIQARCDEEVSSLAQLRAERFAQVRRER